MQTNGSLGMKPKTNEQRGGLQGGEDCTEKDCCGKTGEGKE